MHGHLVTVKVGIERSTHKRMQLNRLTLYQDRLKGLDTKPVQRRRTVQHDRMLLDDILQHIPYLWLQPLHHLLGILYIVGGSVGYKLLHYKGLEQLDGHFLGKSALVNLKFRSNHDNRTSGIVNTLTKQVLTETSLLTFQHIGKRLKGAVAGSCHRPAAAAVVNQGVHCLLEHALLVADNDVRSAQFQQSCKTVVPVDDPSV